MAGKPINYGIKNESNVLILKITRHIESTSRTSVYLQRFEGFYSYSKENPFLPKFNFTEVNIIHDDENQLTNEMFVGIDSVFIPNSRAYIVAKFIKENNLKVCFLGIYK